ncbi:hypothetical protein ACP70R_004299 [Stipagrostis hirtigluma subsp. patula]
MASQPNLPRHNFTANCIKVTSPLLPPAPSIIMSPTAADTSSPSPSQIKNPPGYMGATELETDPDNAESTQVENSQKDRVPKIGMKFYIEQEAYDFYNEYAREKE